MTRRLAPLLLVLVAALAVLAAGPAAAALPNDPEVGRQWGLVDIKAPDAWAKSTGRGISVVVVSTGIGRHPDLAGRTEGGFDATGRADPNLDTGGRGTHLAGIVGAATNNGQGIAGVAPDVRLQPYKAFETDGAVDGQKYLEALQRAASARPHVALIDVPDGIPGDVKDAVRQFLKNMAASGIAVVVGSQGAVSVGDLGVLAVAASAPGGGPAAGTAGVGAKGVAAPGQGVLSTTSAAGLLGGEPTFDYGELSGTGQAAAHAAGAVAILRGLGANATQAADLLRATARKGDGSLGAGNIDVAAAVAAYKPPAPPPASTTTTKKPAATTGTTSPATGLGAIPKATLPTVPGGPTLSGEPAEPGEGESAVLPSGSDDFVDNGEVASPGTPVSQGKDQPLGTLAVGFGLLCGVGTGLSVTFRRLAAATAA